MGSGLAVLFVLISASGQAIAGAEVVDRIVAIIDREVILLSEAERAMGLVERRSNEAASMREVVERLIEARLVEREVERFADSPVPAERVDEELGRFRASFPTPRDFRAMLSARGMREDDLRAEVRRQLTVNRYLERRFRSLIYVSNDEIDSYFEEEILPRLAAERLPSDSERDQIRRILEAKRFNERVDEWLAELKSRSHIRRYVW